MTELLATETWPRISPATLVIVPLGSTEQHGPHLPFGTDSVIATAVATGVADELRARGTAVTVAPTVGYGASGEHQDFPGTASIGTEALQRSLVELVRSLSTWATRIVFVNGHGGNVPALSEAVPAMIAENHLVSWTPCAAQGGDAHAGRTETSVMLHLSPDEVDLELAVAGNTEPIGDLLPRLRSQGVRALSPSGVLGDPTGANADEGAATLSSMIQSATRRVVGDEVDARGCLVDIEPEGRHG